MNPPPIIIPNKIPEVKMKKHENPRMNVSMKVILLNT